ncbi:hypothetical protein ABW19_dt0210217 [Dactylella cylindrospora]|nr:hypothetical protein ABW19_dt0210217 [Dactylella cylindrospora]
MKTAYKKLKPGAADFLPVSFERSDAKGAERESVWQALQGTREITSVSIMLSYFSSNLSNPKLKAIHFSFQSFSSEGDPTSVDILLELGFSTGSANKPKIFEPIHTYNFDPAIGDSSSSGNSGESGSQEQLMSHGDQVWETATRSGEYSSRKFTEMEAKNMADPDVSLPPGISVHTSPYLKSYPFEELLKTMSQQSIIRSEPNFRTVLLRSAPSLRVHSNPRSLVLNCLTSGSEQHLAMRWADSDVFKESMAACIYACWQYGTTDTESPAPSQLAKLRYIMIADIANPRTVTILRMAYEELYNRRLDLSEDQTIAFRRNSVLKSQASRGGRIWDALQGVDEVAGVVEMLYTYRQGLHLAYISSLHAVLTTRPSDGREVVASILLRLEIPEGSEIANSESMQLEVFEEDRLDTIPIATAIEGIGFEVKTPDPKPRYHPGHSFLVSRTQYKPADSPSYLMLQTTYKHGTASRNGLEIFQACKFAISSLEGHLVLVDILDPQWDGWEEDMYSMLGSMMSFSWHTQAGGTAIRYITFQTVHQDTENLFINPLLKSSGFVDSETIIFMFYDGSESDKWAEFASKFSDTMEGNAIEYLMRRHGQGLGRQFYIATIEIGRQTTQDKWFILVQLAEEAMESRPAITSYSKVLAPQLLRDNLESRRQYMDNYLGISSVAAGVEQVMSTNRLIFRYLDKSRRLAQANQDDRMGPENNENGIHEPEFEFESYRESPSSDLKRYTDLLGEMVKDKWSTRFDKEEISVLQSMMASDHPQIEVTVRRKGTSSEEFKIAMSSHLCHVAVVNIPEFLEGQSHVLTNSEVSPTLTGAINAAWMEYYSGDSIKDPRSISLEGTRGQAESLYGIRFVSLFKFSEETRRTLEIVRSSKFHDIKEISNLEIDSSGFLLIENPISPMQTGVGLASEKTWRWLLLLGTSEISAVEKIYTKYWERMDHQNHQIQRIDSIGIKWTKTDGGLENWSVLVCLGQKSIAIVRELPLIEEALGNKDHEFHDVAEISISNTAALGKAVSMKAPEKSKLKFGLGTAFDSRKFEFIGESSLCTGEMWKVVGKFRHSAEAAKHVGQAREASCRSTKMKDRLQSIPPYKITVTSTGLMFVEHVPEISGTPYREGIIEISSVLQEAWGWAVESFEHAIDLKLVLFITPSQTTKSVYSHLMKEKWAFINSAKGNKYMGFFRKNRQRKWATDLRYHTCRMILQGSPEWAAVENMISQDIYGIFGDRVIDNVIFSTLDLSTNKARNHKFTVAVRIANSRESLRQLQQNA